MSLPGDLDAAVAMWMEAHGRGALGASAQQLSATYRKGESSSHVSLAAYVATRVPATFKANQHVQAALAAAMPDFLPRSLLDIGAGPGVAAWAALEAWPSIEKITQCEQDKSFADLAKVLNMASALQALTSADVILKSEVTLPLENKADFVTASYVLAELPLQQMADVASRLWTRTQEVLVLIEPGTPKGFARLRTARDTLLGEGAFVVAPCTHQNACPMAALDWCHFKTRVQRSRLHMHAKQATVPFEDEAFSYLILSRQHVPQSGERIIAPLEESKASVNLKLCGASGLRNGVVASRDKASYKRAKKATWGQVWERDHHDL